MKEASYRDQKPKMKETSYREQELKVKETKRTAGTSNERDKLLRAS